MAIEGADEPFKSDDLAIEIRSSWLEPVTEPAPPRTELDPFPAETIRCKSSWETGPYRVQYTKGGGGVDIGTTTVDLKQLEAFISVLEFARSELIEFG